MPRSHTENGVTFGYLGLKEYETLENAVRSNSIAFLRSRAEEFKLKDVDKFVAFRDARPDIVERGQVYHYAAGTSEGIRKTIGMALEKVGVTSVEKLGEVLDSYGILDLGNLAAHLLGFEQRVAVKGDGQPSPLAPTPDASPGS